MAPGADLRLALVSERSEQTDLLDLASVAQSLSDQRAARPVVLTAVEASSHEQPRECQNRIHYLAERSHNSDGGETMAMRRSHPCPRCAVVLSGGS